MSDSKKNRLPEVIAQKMKQLIEETDAVFLPPMRRLAKKYLVSVTTIHTAVMLLKEKEIVEVYQGGRIRISGREDVSAYDLSASEPQKSSDVLYEAIKKKISNGSYKMGHQLPKVAYCAMTEHVSHHAVTAAYRRLESENLAYKEGRLWFSGPKIKTSPNISILSQPVILVLQTHEGFWPYMAKRPFFEAFCRSFQNEVESYNAQLIPALFEDKNSSLGIVNAGKEALFNYIRKLDTRYMGTLIVNATKEVTNLELWFRDLLLFKRPVVWFDRLKENPPFQISSKFFIRCHEAEQDAVALAVEQLISLGHRKIAFPLIIENSWLLRRKELIEKELQRQCPEAVLFSGKNEANIFQNGNSQTKREMLISLSESSFGFVRSAIEFIRDNAESLFRKVPQEIFDEYHNDEFDGIAALLQYTIRHEEVQASLFPEQPYLPWLITLTPFCHSLLKQNPVTAIIAPNDMIAHKLYLWLKAMKLMVPKDISLLSFDNLWFLQDLPITSVDFGYGYLGFAAFHSITQDVDIKKSKTGSIAAAPRIVHRGTVGVPAKDPQPFC